MKRKNRFKATGVIIFLVIIMIICIIAIKKKKAELSKAHPVDKNPIPVSIVELRKGEFTFFKQYVGIITPLNSSEISSRITAEIIEIKVTEGSNVKKGDVLIRLDDRALKQSIKVLKAKLEGMKTQILANKVKIESLKTSVSYWEKQVSRDKKLFDDNIVSAKAYELSNEKLNRIKGEYKIAMQQNNTYQATLNSITEDVKIAETNLSYAVIAAPFDGVICNVPVDPGVLAIPGKGLVLIENQKLLKVTVLIPQIDMKDIYLKQSLLIATDSNNKIKNTSARITKIYPAIGENRMMKIQAVLPTQANSSLMSGQYVKVKINATTLHNVILAPSAAINIDNCENTTKNLFTVKDGVLKKIPVKILGDNEKTAAVVGNLSEGDKVVVSAFLGWTKLADGLRAEIVK